MICIESSRLDCSFNIILRLLRLPNEPSLGMRGAGGEWVSSSMEVSIKNLELLDDFHELNKLVDFQNVSNFEKLFPQFNIPFFNIFKVYFFNK